MWIVRCTFYTESTEYSEPITSHAHWSHISTFPWSIFHMASTICTLCRLSYDVITFMTTKKKLTFYTGFYSKSLHSPLCSVPGITYLLRSQSKDKAINEQLTWRMIFCRYLSHRRENKLNIALKQWFIECFTLETHPII